MSDEGAVRRALQPLCDTTALGRGSASSAGGRKAAGAGKAKPHRVGPPGRAAARSVSATPCPGVGRGPGFGMDRRVAPEEAEAERPSGSQGAYGRVCATVGGSAVAAPSGSQATWPDTGGHRAPWPATARVAVAGRGMVQRLGKPASPELRRAERPRRAGRDDRPGRSPSDQPRDVQRGSTRTRVRA